MKITGMTKDLQKSVNKHGSVLKAYRSQGGGGAGMVAGGAVLLIFGVFLGLLCLLALGPRGGLVIGGIFCLPGILLVLPGMAKHKKRVKTYLDFYQKETGYTVEELQQADRELMGSGAVSIVGKTSRAKEEILFMLTDHYFLSVWPVKGCYLLKLDDIVAAFHSVQIPGINGYRQGVQIISREDARKSGQKNPYTKKEYGGFENSLMGEQRNAEEICREAVEEIVKRAPHVITYQNIVVSGVQYNLMSMNNWQADWARILGE